MPSSDDYTDADRAAQDLHRELAAARRRSTMAVYLLGRLLPRDARVRRSRRASSSACCATIPRAIRRRRRRSGSARRCSGSRVRRDFDQEFTQKALDQWQSVPARLPRALAEPRGGQRHARSRARGSRHKLVDDGEPLHQAQAVRARRASTSSGWSTSTAIRPPAADAELGIALVDAREDRRDEAIERLQAIETPLRRASRSPQRAARERARLEQEVVDGRRAACAPRRVRRHVRSAARRSPRARRVGARIACALDRVLFVPAGHAAAQAGRASRRAATASP